MNANTDLRLTQTSRPFLTAEWRNVCLATYAVDPARLEPHLPPGLELDTRDGGAFVSLVAFDFLRTKVLGVGWPGYRDFPEINLRFYVRDGDRRGVVFIRELVPRRLIAWVARVLYNEPYRYAPMRSASDHSGGELRVTHEVKCGDRWQTLRVRASKETTVPDESSVEHFFKEHTWGYGRSRSGKLMQYEVRHPVWATHRVLGFDLDWDWDGLYGPEWADLGSKDPSSVILAEGSPVAVSPPLLREPEAHPVK